MRIEQEKERKVWPITIVLENVDDLLCMWHRMNINTMHIRNHTTNQNTLDDAKDCDMASDIFDVVDDELARLHIPPGVGNF